jgi:hypothetical protein
MYRFAVIAVVGLSTYAATARAAEAPPPAANRGTYNPFSLSRAIGAPNAPDNPGLRRRGEIIKRLRDIRVVPPGHQKKRSPFQTDPDGNRGHGNDPDGHDEQNPGNSNGPGNNPGNGNGNGNGRSGAPGRR